MSTVVNATGKHRKKRRHHGEGTVIERRDAWRRSRFVAVVPYRDESGRPQRMWLSARSTRDEAEADREEAVRGIKAGVRPELRSPALGDYLASWLDGQADRLTPGAIDRYRQHITMRLLPSLGARTLVALSAADVRAAMMRWDGGPATRGGTLTVLRAALAQAEDDRLIPHSPARNIRPPILTSHRPKPIDVEEALRLIEAVDADPLMRPLLVTMLGLGLRRGEAIGLRTAYVDCAARTLRVEKQLRRIPPAFRAEGERSTRLTDPKADSARTIPLPEFVHTALHARIELVAAERKASKVYAANDFVFCRPNGNAVPFSSLDRAFKAALERAGLPDMRLHDLRHSTGTILLTLGVDLRVVMEILGHRNITQTLAYQRVLPKVGRDAADRLDRAMAGG